MQRHSKLIDLTALDFLAHLGPPVRMASLSPTTLTADEQALILRVTATNVRDHTIISLALGTGLRLAEIVGLDVADVFAPVPGRAQD